ncbi:hypothetical protein UPYG_G00196120 [Umbra pygmaea]|uniref:Transcobalamin-like C-terminal domain-containing protein n=1 Tax=Umbra pygmaea TaxID=75934 RepID=A0ABD0WZD3_UMBPY
MRYCSLPADLPSKLKMRTMNMATFVSVTLLLLVPGILTEASSKPDSIQLLVWNSIAKTPNVTYTTNIVYRGILIGAMKNLQKTTNFNKFTYTEDPNYGPFLVSVNGVAGNNADKTYWELLVKKPKKNVITPDVGIGCYIPQPNDIIILKLTNY